MSLEKIYQEQLVPKLVSEFGLANKLSAPRVLRVVINMGVGALKDKKEEREKVAAELAAIGGQKPATRLSNKAVSGFNLRSGEPVGLTVTLRGGRMYAFLEKLFKVVLPRVRDFRGVSSRSFDEGGNYTLGITEHTVFPEVDLAKTTGARGVEVTMVTNTRDKKQARRLLEELGLPFAKSSG